MKTIIIDSISEIGRHLIARELQKRAKRNYKQRLSAWLQKDDNSYTYKDDFFGVKKFYTAATSPKVTYNFGKRSQITTITLSQWS